ncbi:hypothetical protein DXG01_001923 [Tephrocybe rancida]|nr:hypothetical protein DXG01_001923 [Tephrocybe rancida]
MPNNLNPLTLLSLVMPGLPLSSGEPDTGIRVIVTPSQSSYFAGEPFAVSITFTNTSSPSPSASFPSSSHPHHPSTSHPSLNQPSSPARKHHKRGAHSISSAPLARPPTSPGLPPPPSLALLHTGGDASKNVLVRRGLVGKVPMPVLPGTTNTVNGERTKGEEDLPELLEQRRKRLLAKSKSKALSVSIAPRELEAQLLLSQSPSSPTPHVPSPLSNALTRSPALPLQRTHPHARKSSHFDLAPSLSTPTPSSPFPSPYSYPAPAPQTPSGSSSTFSLALDPIAEGPLPPSPYPSTPSLPSISHAPFLPNAHLPLAPAPPARRPPNIGIGLGLPSTGGNAGSELILYAYAQLRGTLHLLPAPSSPPTNTNDDATNALRVRLSRKGTMGGGRMDISASLAPSPLPTPGSRHRRRPTHARSSSFSGGLMNLLAASPVPSSPVPSPQSPRFPALPSAGLGLGIDGPATEDEDVDPEAPLPTLNIPPAVLAVDLRLAPGESRTYTYSINLPSVLPPTFRGRAMRFGYELEVGTCRAGGGTGAQAGGSTSRVMKVPVRVYNNVVVGRPPRPYDLLWPLSHPPLPHARVSPSPPPPPSPAPKRTSLSHLSPSSSSLPNQLPTGPEPPTKPPAKPQAQDQQGALPDLADYARRLLLAFPPPPAPSSDSDTATRTVRIKLPAESVSPTPVSPLAQRNPFPWASGAGAGPPATTAGGGGEVMGEGELAGCAEAVEILTRSQRKASYDINKDGVRVAVLTLVKGAYRLGESVLGVVEVNGRGGRGGVLKLTALLEAHESLPSPLNPAPAPHPHPAQTQIQVLKRTHASHHASFTPCTLRTTFSLDIPSDASPGFGVRVDGPAGEGGGRAGGLEWRVRLCLLVGVAVEAAEGGDGAAGAGGLWGERVYTKGLVRDGPRGEWGSAWVAPRSIAPFERAPPAPPRTPHAHARTRTPKTPRTPGSAGGWGAFLAASLFGSSLDPDSSSSEDDEQTHAQAPAAHDGPAYTQYDGIRPHPSGGVGVGVDYDGGGEGAWREMRLETVECEVPIGVWPANTAFRAGEVVFDV